MRTANVTGCTDINRNISRRNQIHQNSSRERNGRNYFDKTLRARVEPSKTHAQVTKWNFQPDSEGSELAKGKVYAC